MPLSIEPCSDETIWKHVGREANADQPEYLEENLFWPVHEAPLNGGTDLSVIARLGNRPVGRLMRRKDVLIELSVAKEHRHKGVGTALIQFAAEDARRKGSRSLRVIEIDEEDTVCLAFFDKLGYRREPMYSMVADLSEGIPANTRKAAENLQRQGFRSRVLDNGKPDDRKLAIALQTRYFASFPGFMPADEMVGIILDRGLLAMVLERERAVAGFIIGGINTTTRSYRHVRRPGWGLLSSIATVEEFRRMGVASTIMCEFVELLKRSGMTHMLYGGCGPEGGASRNVAKSVGARREVRHFALQSDLTQAPL